jgi:hypothetical protein
MSAVAAGEAPVADDARTKGTGQDYLDEVGGCGLHLRSGRLPVDAGGYHDQRAGVARLLRPDRRVEVALDARAIAQGQLDAHGEALRIPAVLGVLERGRRIDHDAAAGLSSELVGTDRDGLVPTLAVVLRIDIIGHGEDANYDNQADDHNRADDHESVLRDVPPGTLQLPPEPVRQLRTPRGRLDRRCFHRLRHFILQLVESDLNIVP